MQIKTRKSDYGPIKYKKIFHKSILNNDEDEVSKACFVNTKISRAH